MSQSPKITQDPTRAAAPRALCELVVDPIEGGEAAALPPGLRGTSERALSAKSGGLLERAVRGRFERLQKGSLTVRSGGPKGSTSEIRYGDSAELSTGSALPAHGVVCLQERQRKAREAPFESVERGLVGDKNANDLRRVR